MLADRCRHSFRIARCLLKKKKSWLNFERAERSLGRRFLDARRVEDEERNWSLQGQRGKGVARFATGRSVDFFSAGPRYFLRPYLNLRARTYLSVVRAPAPAPGPFMRKMSVTRTTINPQFSCPLPALYSRARFQVFFFSLFFSFARYDRPANVARQRSAKR